LLKEWPAGGPPIVWEMTHGTGYASPAISGEKLVYFHRVNDENVVECLRAETGERYWRFKYETGYHDRFGYNNGPRCSPVIDGDRVYVFGASGLLHCLNLDSGAVVWGHDIQSEFKLTQNFFGVGSTPLVEGQLLIVNVGAGPGQSVVAFDKTTGKQVWAAGDWGPSYASPLPADLHGKRRVLVFAGGESSPPSGGLLCIDPADGKLDFAFPFRSSSVESVNAAMPTLIGNQVFITASYGTGGALLDISPEFKATQAWKTTELGAHITTSILHDGQIYGIDGRHPEQAHLTCLDAKIGKTLWRDPLTWKETADFHGEKHAKTRGIGRGSLLLIEGGRLLLLGEYGDLLLLEVSAAGCKVLQRARLFDAPESWSPPVISRGLLYLVQNYPDVTTKVPPRLFCCDLRAAAP
jgi:outer membrane protein assembly factor BamB